jgi:hypothetical protein
LEINNLETPGDGARETGPVAQLVRACA